jgi:hypothetical protein
MSGGSVTRSEFERYIKSTAANNLEVKDCLKQLTKNSTEFNEYIIHNDHRHLDTDRRMTAQAKEQNQIKEDVAKILRMMSERKGFWKALDNLSKFGKFVVITILLGILTAAGAGIYNYVTKAETPAIKPIKEGAK